VREIVAVPGRVEGDIVETEPVFAWSGGHLRRSSGYPPHLHRFEERGFDVASLLDRAVVP
jgi:pilus assembly protein CpaF